MEQAIYTGEPEPQKIKLNLGCGNKILNGWINVDVTSRHGRQPDVVSDIRKLELENDYADEVMAVHVVEHFYLWEVPDLLTEWIRVLRPGGKMIIEVPDLVKVMNYMASGISEPALTMWPLYGDPSHEDPLMGHKWGYTEGSLARMMDHVGLEKLERKPAEYHMKDQRDMRIVGYKSGD